MRTTLSTSLFPSSLAQAGLVVAFCLLVGAGQAAESTYAVKKGDTLSTIARAHETTSKELVRLNNLKSANLIRAGQHLRVPALEIDYKVRKGDTLSTIARAHNVGTRTLTDYNGLADPDRLAVGDVLRIPLRSTQNSMHRLPPDLERQLNRIRVKDRRWKHIVIHHSATKNGTVEGIDRFHREKGMENGLAYHFVIGNGNGMTDGITEIGDRWKKQLHGGHLANNYLNSQSIGICLIGNFETGRPTARQMKNLHALCTYLTRRCKLGRSAIKTHTQINPKPTKCPGKHFPSQQFLSDFRG